MSAVEALVPQIWCPRLPVVVLQNDSLPVARASTRAALASKIAIRPSGLHCVHVAGRTARGPASLWATDAAEDAPWGSIGIRAPTGRSGRSPPGRNPAGEPARMRRAAA